MIQNLVFYAYVRCFKKNLYWNLFFSFTGHTKLVKYLLDKFPDAAQCRDKVNKLFINIFK